MKKLTTVLLALALVLSCSGTVMAEEAVTLVYAELNPIDSIAGTMASDFKAKVEELSGGSITIDLQPNGVMGTEDEVLKGILNGDTGVDIARISAFALSSFGCTKATLLSLPFTFISRDHFWTFAKSELADEFLAEPQELGLPLRGICYGEEGFRNFFFRDPVTGIDDLKGMKIRISDDPVMTGLVNGLGATATNIPFTELYSHLQTGDCDGAEQPIVNYKSNSFCEVAPNLLLDGHTLGAIQLVITDNAWNRLSEQQQAWIMEAGEYASKLNAQNSRITENAVLQELRDEGVTIVEVPDKSVWIEACAGIITANMNGNEDIYMQIMEMAPRY